MYANKNCINRGENIIKAIEYMGLSKQISIMELGCNVGRNLELLRDNGYYNLYGIDINNHAFDVMKKTYPDLYKILNKSIGRIGNVINDIVDEYDVIFTMAVLIHIDDSERGIIFDWLQNHCKYFVSVEPIDVETRESMRLFNKIDTRKQLEMRNFETLYDGEAYFKFGSYSNLLIMKNNHFKFPL